MAVARSIPILMYHHIDAVPSRDDPLWTLHVAPAKFEAQMRWMHRLGYRGLSMRDLLPYLRGERQGKVFGITFDDGYCNVLDHAAPVLQRLGFTSTCYFVAAKLGQHNDWDAHLGTRSAALMDAEQVRRWAALGQEVGSHTLDHCHLPQLSAAAAEQQIRGSRESLESAAQSPVESFCYPYGDWHRDLAAMVQSAGYSNATVTERGLACAKDDPFALPRVTVSAFTGLPKFLYRCLTRAEDRRRRTV